MKNKIISFVLLFAMLIMLTIPVGATVFADEVSAAASGSENTTEVEIKDPTLARAIRLQLGLNNDEIITTSQMESMEGLLLSYCTVTTLDGLEYAGNIHSLSFDHCTIGDYTALTKLNKLSYLQLNGNGLTSDQVGFISELDSVETLDLSYNELTDINFLKDMDSIVSLILSGNSIVSLDPLLTLDNVQTIYLASNDLTSEQLTIIKPMLSKLYELDLDYNKISDLSVFESMEGMRGLYLNSNQITDISPIAGLTSDNVVALQIKQNQLDLSINSETMNQINSMKDNGITVSYSSSMQDQTDRQQERKELERLEQQEQKQATNRNLIILAIVCAVFAVAAIVAVLLIRRKRK